MLDLVFHRAFTVISRGRLSPPRLNTYLLSNVRACRNKISDVADFSGFERVESTASSTVKYRKQGGFNHHPPLTL